MFPNKKRYALYAVVLMLISVVHTSVFANKNFHEFITEVVSVVDTTSEKSTEENFKELSTSSSQNKITRKHTVAAMAAPIIMTIIQGADDSGVCRDNDFTIARFILCGDSDDRTISLSGGPYSNVSWQQLGGSCTPDTNELCPNTTASCYAEVSTSQTYDLDASAISATDGAEFRVVADGRVYYFEVIKSTIDQSYLKTDFICGSPGKIELTGLPNSYIFRIREEGNPTFSSYQSSSVFSNLLPGRYVIDTKLDITGDVCVYTYPIIEIVEENIDINVNFTDILCLGQAGSIDIEVLPDNIGPFVFTLLDDSGLEIEFTSTLASNTHTFNAVNPGTYLVKVETNECKEDIPNGIPAPIQDRDTSGNPIIIGNGLTPINVATSTDGYSFGCSTITSVDINISITGGTSPYSYTVSDGGNSSGTFASTDIYRVTSEGTYTFFITDAAGCTATKSEYVAEIVDPPVVTAVGVNGTCNNGGTRIEFEIIDSQGFNIEYRVDSADSWSSSQTLFVPEGTYNTIGVRYFQGGFECTLALPSVTVISQISVTGAATRTQDFNCVNVGGIIDFDAAATGGGSGVGYEYSIDNITYQSGTSFTGLAPGTYVPYVRDDSGCAKVLASIDINEPEEPSAIDFVQDQLDCTMGTSRVTVNVTSGVTITQYEIISPLSLTQSSNVFSDLILDTAYQFEITDANGCVYPANFTTGGFSTIRARVKSGGDRRVCSSATDGNGAFIIDGYATDYDYTITGPGTFTTLNGVSSNLEIQISALAAGTYTINVTDNDTNCSDSASLVIEEPAMPLSVAANEIAMTCQNNNSGQVVALPIGGFVGYTYRLDWPLGTSQGPKSETVFDNLTEEGIYTLTIIDDEGCEATDTFELTEIDSPTIILDSADYCYSATNDASITVTSLPGTAAIVGYRIGTSGPTQTNPTFTGLVPGNYVIQVIDANDCTDETAEIIIPPETQVRLNLVTEIACGGDGQMQIIVNNGIVSDLTGMSYTVFKDGVAVVGYTGNQLPSNLFNYNIPFGEHGDYTVEITNSQGGAYICSALSEPLTFVEPSGIVATERIVGTNCNDPNSGLVEIIPTVSSGIPPFQVVFAPAPTAGILVADALNSNAGATTFAFSSQTIYSSLPIGFYEYVVKDSRSCLTDVIRIEVVADPILAPDTTITPIDAVCSSSNIVSGGVTLDNISNGSPDFTVVIEDNFGNSIFTQNNITLGSLPLSITNPSLVPGEYIIRTIDSRGCTDEDVLNIISTTIDIVEDISTLPSVCSAVGFMYCVDIVGGVGPFDIREIEIPAGPFIALGGTPPTPNRRYCFSNVQFGESFMVEVRDNDTGCIYEELVTVPENLSGAVDVSLAIDNATCIPGNLVELAYTVTGSTGNLDIEIINLDTGAIFISETRTETTYSYQVLEGPYGISVVDAGGCAGGATAEAILNIPRVDIIDNQNANCNEPGQLTVRGSGGDGGPYEYAFLPTGTLPVPTDFTNATTVFLPGSLAPGTNYDIWVRDGTLCDFMTSAVVVQLDPDLPTPTFSVDNQCSVINPLGGFAITLEMPGNIDTPSFTLNGETQAPVYVPGIPTVATFNVNSVGEYRVDVIDANGCSSFAEPEVFQSLSASGGFGVNQPTCTDADGIITITVNGGSGDFDFELQDDLGNSITNQPSGIFTGIPFGNYQVVVTDNGVFGGVPVVACDFTVSGIVSTAPTSPEIQIIDQNNMSCYGDLDGSINVMLQTGTDIDGIQEYNLYTSDLASYSGTTPTATNNTGLFNQLDADTYVVEVVTNRGCSDAGGFTITSPPAFTVEAVAGTLICEIGANRFSTTEITATITDLGSGAPYGFKLDPADSYQFTNTTSQIFEIVDTGLQQSFLVYAIDSNGCEFVIPNPIVIDPPITVSAVISSVSDMECEGPERITVTVVGSTDFTIEDQGSSVAFVPNVVQDSGTSVTFDLPLMAGEYRLQVNDSGGCSYPIAPYIVDSYSLPNAVINEAEPIGCFNALDGALNINVTDFSGVYEYIIYSANDSGFTGGTFGTPVAGNSTGTVDMLADGNPFVISGLPAGNLRAVINEQGKTNMDCIVYSTVATIRSPNGPLSISDLTGIGRVGCDNTLGEITVTAMGGWDSSPYQFMLEIENPLNSGNYDILIPLGPTSSYTGITSSGRYRITVEDIEGCSVSEVILIEPVPPIDAEASIMRQLECPDGNDAIIEAVAPGTTIPGAIGGVVGAGYQYSLLTLNSDDNLDVLSFTGLQSTPRFVGVDVTGVIEAGWYAIEVVSTLNCSFRTAPIQVIAPLTIVPRIIQTAVPACGNIATMKIELGASAEVGAAYEYRNYLSSDPWLPMTDQNGAAEELISGVVGVSYRFEVRKVGDLRSCDPIATNGITITITDPLDLDGTSPAFDISCAFQVDGRIEAQVEGGTGIYEFRIYNIDPGTDAFFAEALPTYNGRPVQNSGTFEDLEVGSYWVSVINRLDCGEIEGPFVINSPEPIEIISSSTSVSCNGAGDGTITMTVTSPNSGLVKFAIEPNLSELVTDPDNPESYTFTDLDAGIYTILSQDAEGCPQTFEVEVTEPDQLIINNLQTTNTLCIATNDGTAFFAIEGGTPFNNPLISATPYYEYKLEMISPIDETGTGVFVPYDGNTIENLQGGATYAIFIQDENLCAANDLFTIGIDVSLIVESIVQYGCEGIFPNSTSSVLIDDKSLLPDLLFYLEDINSTDPPLTEQEMIDVANLNYTWGDLPASQYRVHVFHRNGCSASAEFEVNQYEPLTLEALKTAPNELTASVEGGFGEYEFFFQGEPAGDENVFTTFETTVVNVRVVDKKGCESEITIPFEFTVMVEFPNFFTPDGDSLNDVWSPNNRQYFPDIDVKIYDRYGRVVAELDETTSWNGTYEGNELPTGDYWYVVNANDKNKIRYVGHFTLYR